MKRKKKFFRQLDAAEEMREDTVKKAAELEMTAAITQTTSLVQCHTKPGVRDGSMPGSSAIMAMRMLKDD